MILPKLRLQLASFIFLMIVGCKSNSPFEQIASNKAGWTRYENDLLQFEVPERYWITSVSYDTSSFLVTRGGEISSQARENPELHVYFYDGDSYLYCHYSTLGMRGPRPGTPFEEDYHFEQDSILKYVRTFSISKKFDQGNPFGGIYVADSTDYLNDVYLGVSVFTPGMKKYDVSQSTLSEEELRYMAKTVSLKK